jgi:hypothetical protein
MRFNIGQLFGWTTWIAIWTFCTVEMAKIVGWGYTLIAFAWLYAFTIVIRESIWVSREPRFVWTPEQVN